MDLGSVINFPAIEHLRRSSTSIPHTHTDRHPDDISWLEQGHAAWGKLDG